MNSLKKYKRKIMLGAGLLGLVATTSVSANTLVYCAEASPENFNPQVVTSGISMDAGAVPVYNRLVEFKLGTTEIEPGLAQSWEISEDGKHYTFHLRDGVKWHTSRDFKPTRDMNADDVIFSFMRQKDENHPYNKVSGGNYAYFTSMGMDKLIESIEKIDDKTVRFNLIQPEAPFLANMAMAFASIFSAEYADQMLKAGTPEKFDLQPIGTGPFQFMQYQKDSRILYRAFTDYWGPKAQIERLVFTITPDPAVRFAKLQKGECQAMPYPNLADVQRMKADNNIDVHEMSGLNIGYLSFNIEKPPLDNLKVREALSVAVNKAAIIDAVFQGAAQPATNFIPPSMWGYNNDIVDRPYDVEKAKELLKEAGFEKGFTIDLWAMPVQRPYNPNARRMAEMIQADWAKIGVTAKIVSYEWGEYLSRIRRGEHQTVLMGWSGDNGDPDNFYSILMSCDAITAGTNYSRWCYEPFDKLLQQARVESNHDRRVELYKQAQVEMFNQAPALMIAHSMVYMPVRKDVQGYIMDPLALHNFNRVTMK
ncbi:ABC transporter substrate-binding protein [Zophobihabitans entericus]|uniref:ABC transporter substrate-binding protein n=1 Tax=Zophobihabitans entericus TaxID=1635327 RepID=A0A6G9I9F8_9GAMM|nr:ABC transporter substrate-binding protein [Zophobihabitans entericus]QIQ20853.1 ABC transporter substrate-binding protein [Zophobihabitans entericus]